VPCRSWRPFNGGHSSGLIVPFNFSYGYQAESGNCIEVEYNNIILILCLSCIGAINAQKSFQESVNDFISKERRKTIHAILVLLNACKVEIEECGVPYMNNHHRGIHEPDHPPIAHP
jgi:hypothetical protein